MKTRIVCTTVAALAVGTFQASAQEGDRPKREVPPEAIEQFDEDGDGQLNEDERKAAREARAAKMKERRQAMLDKFDTDGDGELNEDEREAMREAMKARHAELLDKYDDDGDGKLSKEERQAAIDAGEKISPRPRARAKRGGEGKGGRDGKPGRPGRKGGAGGGAGAGFN